MNTQAAQQTKDNSTSETWPQYQSILLAVDSSDHSNRAVEDAVSIAEAYHSKVTAAHVYAAKMHDMRFKQMEGGLPEQFREEDELERQRDVHDDLITRGLSIITDSYLTQAEILCHKKNLNFQGRSLEGKNYREMTCQANNGEYDLLVMGSLGLGAIQNSRIGTVTERVTRRSVIDTLVIKEPKRSLTSGPIVCAIDGSSRSFGGLRTAIQLAKLWQTPLHVISAFDPHYHYVAFNRIAGVLSAEDAKVFRFKEQEKLHEEIIDDGLAKIYQAHLDVAKTIADEQDIQITFKLLDGKPHDAIERYISAVNPSLLVIGKLGIHADEYLDIGGNAENLLRNTSCAVLFSMREYTPRVDVIAENTTSWTHQAEDRMKSIPPFVQGMARMSILRYAQQKGHTVITASIVDEATRNLCPAGMKTGTSKALKPSFYDMSWSVDASKLLASVTDETLRDNTRKRAEKKAKLAGSEDVKEEHILPFVIAPKIKQQNEMQQNMKNAGCPFAQNTKQPNIDAPAISWSTAAEQRIANVPDGFMRTLTRQRIETYAHKNGHKKITVDVINKKYRAWKEGSGQYRKTMHWELEAEKLIQRIPDFIQAVVIKEMENCAQDMGLQTVTRDVLKKARSCWSDNASFHSDNAPDQYKN